MKISEDPNIIRVATHSPLQNFFDYKLPSHIAHVEVGMRVKVPFGKRDVLGVVIEIAKEASIAESKLKTIHEVIDEVVLFSPPLLELCRWASDYYHYPLGEIIFGIMPKLLRQGKPLMVSDTSNSEEKLPASPTFKINEEQKKAIASITSSSGFEVFLLEGVTGSGKTEVYLQVIARILQEGQQALVLIPEISLTPQTIERFQQRFSVPLAVLHSSLTDRQRALAWSNARNGNAKIIIGTRSAIFVPMQNPGIIILDEEHDPSFKQQSRFRYSARDLAIVRGRFEKIPVILGSATPSLESLHNAKNGRYQLLQLQERAAQVEMPKISMLDLRRQKLEGGLSASLLQSIRNYLDQKQQVLLFLNRRGYAPVVLCHHCGFMVKCKSCDAQLTLHQKLARLFCHHCGSSQTQAPVCPECRQSTLSPVGAGTERLEEVLHQYFPDKQILRIDSDNVSKKDDLEKFLQKIHQGEGDILIGTQMLAKGHHFPNLNFVAIVDADNGLFSSDFRALERMGQLMIQVAGRAGREKEQGSVVIQTYHPENHMLELLTQKSYSDFAGQLLEERKNACLPPFSYLALLRAEAIQSAKAMQFLTVLKKKIEKFNRSINILGPVPPVMEKKAGRYRAQLLFRSANRPLLHLFLSQVLKEIHQIKNFRQVRWALDVDPQEVI